MLGGAFNLPLKQGRRKTFRCSARRRSQQILFSFVVCSSSHFKHKAMFAKGLRILNELF